MPETENYQSTINLCGVNINSLSHNGRGGEDEEKPESAHDESTEGGVGCENDDWRTGTISLELTGVIHKELFNLLGDGGIWFQLKHLSFLGLENETAVYYCCYTDCC